MKGELEGAMAGGRGRNKGAQQGLAQAVAEEQKYLHHTVDPPPAPCFSFIISSGWKESDNTQAPLQLLKLKATGEKVSLSVHHVEEQTEAVLQKDGARRFLRGNLL